MIKSAIIDDEKSSVEMLQWLINTYCPNVEVVFTTNQPAEGIELLKKHQPELLFLDIEMPGMSGFDLLERLEKFSFQVVFTTAHDQFALRAFKYSALNYLLKPIDPDELQATIQRLEEKRSVLQPEQISVLLENLRPDRGNSGRIALTTGDGLIFVKSDDILYCKADSNYTEVKMSDNRKIVVSKTLKDLDATLSGLNFFRVHNSFLINLNHISRYVKGDGGYIVMPDGTEISIARSKREEFFQLFSKF